MINNLLTVKEMADLCHTSPRTLKYYEELGLLHPYTRTAAGYRLYQMNQADRVTNILLYERCGLSLKEIRALLNEPGLPGSLKALQKQEELTREQLERLRRQQIRTQSLIEEIQTALQHLEKPFTSYLSKIIRVEELKEPTSLFISGQNAGVIFNDFSAAHPCAYFTPLCSQEKRLDGSFRILYTEIAHEHFSDILSLLQKDALDQHLHPAGPVYMETVMNDYGQGQGNLLKAYYPLEAPQFIEPSCK